MFIPVWLLLLALLIVLLLFEETRALLVLAGTVIGLLLLCGIVFGGLWYLHTRYADQDVDQEVEAAAARLYQEGSRELALWARNELMSLPGCPAPLHGVANNVPAPAAVTDDQILSAAREREKGVGRKLNPLEFREVYAELISRVQLQADRSYVRLYRSNGCIDVHDKTLVRILTADTSSQ